MAIFQFFLPPGKWIEVIFFLSFPPENFYDIWPKPTKISTKSIKLLLHKIFVTLSPNWKVKV